MQPQGTLPSRSTSPARVLTSIEESLVKDVVPCRNLGSFVTTLHSEPVCKLVAQSLHKNQACMEEYPSISKFKQACISILAELWNKKSSDSPYGLATTGSSEAILLAGVAMRNIWMAKSVGNSRPNAIFGSNAHVCVAKFAQYLDVEPRVIPVSSRSGYTIDPLLLQGKIDQHTIGIFLTLGTTYTGHCDPIGDVAAYLDKVQSELGFDIPIHVDAASGGFVLPFSVAHDGPAWDFRIPRVVSINASGHKFGFAPSTVGWLLWRDIGLVSENLMLESSYLRGSQSEFTLSFSRSGASVVGQYYNFQHFGLEGYRRKINQLLELAYSIGSQLEDTGYFHCLSNAHHPCRGCGNQPPGIPVVVFTFSETFKKQAPVASLADVGDRMLEQGFAIPHYRLQKWGSNGEDIEVLRMVIRGDTRDQVRIASGCLVDIVASTVVAPSE
ncbi:PLP-dependent transferase [Aspergillus taichungensis]|uniref:Glutamate decarboxylase n=1 Tax=Aspergillus taichungensis TaxID=482145 RepID=A0A2J5HYM1_9EURO|nr:PLP-dependent transferase [Aspergillus taichungensis]